MSVTDGGFQRRQSETNEAAVIIQLIIMNRKGPLNHGI